MNSDQPRGSAPFFARLFAPGSALMWIGAVALVVVLGVWLQFTPDGLLGKADAVGYAVCHRIRVRSFILPNGRQVPLCARCSGTFLGVMLGLFGPGWLFKRRHHGGFPPLAMLAVMLGMSAWWAFDGANSFAHLLPYEGIPRLYGPTNFLRITTGMAHGITMGGLILPVANATLWVDASNEPIMDKWWRGRHSGGDQHGDGRDRAGARERGPDAGRGPAVLPAGAGCDVRTDRRDRLFPLCDVRDVGRVRVLGMGAESGG
jgi:uncharacterized membrane protein